MGFIARSNPYKISWGEWVFRGISGVGSRIDAGKEIGLIALKKLTEFD
jgi:hypothetical protein